jgi:hypothetical protein
LIAAPQYTYRSAGVRALYRLCLLMNRAGFSCAIAPLHPFDTKPFDDVPIYFGPAEGSVVLYPEVVAGNPLNGRVVVRWAMNYPGRLGGEERYGPDDLVFVFADTMRAETAEITGIAPELIRTLFIPIIDPRFIYPDATAVKDISCSFTYHGEALSKQFRLPDEDALYPIELHASSMWALGHLLRRCRTLYSYDHGSTVLKEAVIAGCDVLVMHDDGVLRDPRTCGCSYNADWNDGFVETYAAQFDNLDLILPLVRQLDRLHSGWRNPRPLDPGFD